MKIPASVEKTGYGQRLRRRSERRVIKRAISDLYVKMKQTEMEIVDANLYLMQKLNLPKGWTERIRRWVSDSLREGKHRVMKRL